MELPTWSAILPSYTRLTLAVFIADMFHTIVPHDLPRQVFADAKIFELEKLLKKLHILERK